MSRVNDPVLLRKIYSQKSEEDAPAPWQRIYTDISGVVAVGFGCNSEWLAVLSHSGLGVVDTPSGKIVSLETGDIDFKDDYPLFVDGIGPLKGERIVLSGIWGGALRTRSRDAWMIAPNWPAESVVLCPPNKIAFEEVSTATVLVKDEASGIRAFGFSDSGKSLIVCSEELYIWKR